MSKKAIDPRDLQLGRSNVKDNKELIDFYSKLEAKSTTAFWKRANDIEPWEPVTRYVPTIWRYSELRDLVLQYDDDGNETLEIDEFVALFHDNFYGDIDEEEEDEEAKYGPRK